VLRQELKPKGAVNVGRSVQEDPDAGEGPMLGALTVQLVAAAIVGAMAGSGLKGMLSPARLAGVARLAAEKCYAELNPDCVDVTAKKVRDICSRLLHDTIGGLMPALQHNCQHALRVAVWTVNCEESEQDTDVDDSREAIELTSAEGVELFRIFTYYSTVSAPDDLDHMTENAWETFCMDIWAVKKGLNESIAVPEHIAHRDRESITKAEACVIYRTRSHRGDAGRGAGYEYRKLMKGSGDNYDGWDGRGTGGRDYGRNLQGDDQDVLGKKTSRYGKLSRRFHVGMFQQEKAERVEAKRRGGGSSGLMTFSIFRTALLNLAGKLYHNEGTAEKALRRLLKKDVLPPGRARRRFPSSMMVVMRDCSVRRFFARHRRPIYKLFQLYCSHGDSAVQNMLGGHDAGVSAYVMTWRGWLAFVRESQLSHMLSLLELADIYLSSADERFGDMHHLPLSGFAEALTRLALHEHSGFGAGIYAPAKDRLEAMFMNISTRTASKENSRGASVMDVNTYESSPMRGRACARIAHDIVLSFRDSLGVSNADRIEETLHMRHI
jgi:hypothetical protein